MQRSPFTCRYGTKCQFAHGAHELRSRTRAHKYKTTKCKNFWLTGSCHYGVRCNFVHADSSSMPASSTAGLLPTGGLAAGFEFGEDGEIYGDMAAFIGANDAGGWIGGDWVDEDEDGGEGDEDEQQDSNRVGGWSQPSSAVASPPLLPTRGGPGSGTVGDASANGSPRSPFPNPSAPGFQHHRVHHLQLTPRLDLAGLAGGSLEMALNSGGAGDGHAGPSPLALAWSDMQQQRVQHGGGSFSGVLTPNYSHTSGPRSRNNSATGGSGGYLRSGGYDPNRRGSDRSMVSSNGNNSGRSLTGNGPFSSSGHSNRSLGHSAASQSGRSLGMVSGTGISGRSIGGSGAGGPGGGSSRSLADATGLDTSMLSDSGGYNNGENNNGDGGKSNRSLTTEATSSARALHASNSSLSTGPSSRVPSGRSVLSTVAAGGDRNGSGRSLHQYDHRQQQHQQQEFDLHVLEEGPVYNEQFHNQQHQQQQAWYRDHQQQQQPRFSSDSASYSNSGNSHSSPSNFNNRRAAPWPGHTHHASLSYVQGLPPPPLPPQQQQQQYRHDQGGSGYLLQQQQSAYNSAPAAPPIASSPASQHPSAAATSTPPSPASTASATASVAVAAGTSVGAMVDSALLYMQKQHGSDGQHAAMPAQVSITSSPASTGGAGAGDGSGGGGGAAPIVHVHVTYASPPPPAAAQQSLPSPTAAPASGFDPNSRSHVRRVLGRGRVGGSSSNSINVTMGASGGQSPTSASSASYQGVGVAGYQQQMQQQQQQQQHFQQQQQQQHAYSAYTGIEVPGSQRRYSHHQAQQQHQGGAYGGAMSPESPPFHVLGRDHRSGSTGMHHQPHMMHPSGSPGRRPSAGGTYSSSGGSSSGRDLLMGLPGQQARHQSFSSTGAGSASGGGGGGGMMITSLSDLEVRGQPVMGSRQASYPDDQGNGQYAYQQQQQQQFGVRGGGGNSGRKLVGGPPIGQSPPKPPLHHHQQQQQHFSPVEQQQQHQQQFHFNQPSPSVRRGGNAAFSNSVNTESNRSLRAGSGAGIAEATAAAAASSPTEDDRLQASIDSIADVVATMGLAPQYLTSQQPLSASSSRPFGSAAGVESEFVLGLSVGRPATAGAGGSTSAAGSGNLAV